jgi:hypothetical protein
MPLATAKRFVEILAMKGAVGRVCDQYGNPQTDYVYAAPKTEEITRYNSHEQFVYHNRGIEIPVVFARHLNKYYFKFTNNPLDPNAPIDQSISADSPAELVDRFLDNPGIAQAIKDRYKIDESFAAPALAETQAATPTITTTAGTWGTAYAGVRPGSARQ